MQLRGQLDKWEGGKFIYSCSESFISLKTIVFTPSEYEYMIMSSSFMKLEACSIGLSSANHIYFPTLSSPQE